MAAYWHKGIEDRTENIRCLAEAGALPPQSPTPAPSSSSAPSPPTPYAADRAAARAIHAREQLPFFEVFVDAPLDICRTRDPKGLYKKSSSGELKGLTGVDAPYEAPTSPDLRLQTGDTSIEAECESLLAMLSTAGILQK